MKDYKSRWNNYKIGKVNWINTNKNHPCRNKFIEYVLSNDIVSIIEVGAGEIIEGRILIGNNPNISYNVMDVSDTFLNYCKSVDGIKAFKGDMMDAPFDDKQFDLVYMSSVLSHSPDIVETIKEMSRISNKFYFNIFKWLDGRGGLKSKYRGGKKSYYSTSFNIDMLIDLISDYGEIEDTFISYKDDNSQYTDFCEYRQNNDISNHRNGNYLTIKGIWSNE